MEKGKDNVPKEDSGYIGSGRSRQSSPVLAGAAFDQFKFNLFNFLKEMVEKPQKQLETYRNFETYNLTSKGMLKVFDLIIAGEETKPTLGLLLLNIVDVSLNSEVILSIIEKYQQEEGSFLYSLIDQNKQNILHHLSALIVQKSRNLQFIGREDFDIYYQISALEPELVKQIDYWGNTPLDIISTGDFDESLLLEVIATSSQQLEDLELYGNS